MSQPAQDIKVDPIAERAARRLAAVEELTRIGMNLARALDAKVAQAAAEADGTGAVVELGLAFSRISRAVRLTLSLEARLDEDGQAHDARMAAERKVREAEAAQARFEMSLRASKRRNKTAGVIEQAIQSEIDDAGEAERLVEALYEKLHETDEAEFARGDFCLSAMIARICAELGVEPDWELWENEDWAIDEATDRVPGSPYVGPRTWRRVDAECEPAARTAPAWADGLAP